MPENQNTIQEYKTAADELDSDDSIKPFLEDAESDSIVLPSKEDTIRRRLLEGLSLTVFTLFQVFSPIFVRLAHKEATQHGVTFLGTTTVFAAEVLKIILSCILIPIHHKSVKKLFTLVYQSFRGSNKWETLKICAPALIYVIQNNLYFFALQRIDATLFSLTYQLRILPTAVLMVIILGKRFSPLQWVALFISLVGAITVQLGQTHDAHASSRNAVSDKVVGLSAVLVMCTTNAFGGVYLEAVMKKSEDDIFLQNIRLSLVSLPMAAISMLPEYETIQESGFFVGWNYFVWIIVFMGAIGGLVFSLVIRYADNIKRSFCPALALGGTAWVSIMLGDSAFTVFLVPGVVLVVISIILYATSPVKHHSRERVASDEERLLDEETNSDECAQKV